MKKLKLKDASLLRSACLIGGEWVGADGGGTIIGLAPSAAAADALRSQIDTQTDTLAKLTHSLEQARETGAAMPAWVAGIDSSTLVVIDEAGMADTLSLDAAVSYILERGGSVRLIGDDQQLSAIGAGGVLRDIRATHGALQLTELVRFRDPAEGAASLALRKGKSEALGFYLDRDRVHVGDLATMTEDVFAAWHADRAAGLPPCCAVSTAGTTAATSIDPVAEVQAIAAQEGLWHHIDAAYDGPAAILPECRWMLEGAAQADSIVVNPHKWLFTPIDLSAFYCRRPEALREAFSLVPSYLRTDQNPRAVNLMDYGIPLGRRFRALKLWFVMRWFGRRGVEEILRSHIAWARELAAEIEADPRFELCAPVPLSLVCFRLRASDEANRRLVDLINRSGFAFLAGNTLGGRFMLRLAIGHVRTTRDDVWAVWERIRAAADQAASDR